MIKKIIISFCLLFSLVSFAQEGTSSPYSFYGIGDVKFKGTVESRSMGGISVFPDSIHINLQNPAHLASLKLTTLSAGATYSNTNFKTETQEGKARRSTLDYLAVGLPTGKWGIGFGLIPYSSVGYKIQKIADENSPITRRYNGIGGINKLFFGLGYKLTKNFNIGADIQYNFGTIETKSLRFVDDVQFGTREKNLSDIQGVSFTTGLTYQTKITSKLSYFGSASYSPESNLKLENSRKIATVQFFSQGGEFVVDEEDIDVANTTLKLPSKVTFGSGFGEVKKWLIGAEVSFQSTSNLGNRFNDIDNVKFENATRYSLGGYFIPNYNSYSSYFKKVTYRGGLRYENTGLIIENKSIEDFAVNLGLGLPLGGTFSKVNVGLEIGKRGTKYANLVEENYVNLSIGLSLNDRWFVKRKYD
jgi:hypothetical protein